MKERLIKRFEDEVNALERELHMELPKEIQRARELGDLRENAEYQAAKERQTYVNARIAMLKRRMSEIALGHFAEIDYRLKTHAKQFWAFLDGVQEVRRGVREARDKSSA